MSEENTQLPTDPNAPAVGSDAWIQAQLAIAAKLHAAGGQTQGIQIDTLDPVTNKPIVKPGTTTTTAPGTKPADLPDNLWDAAKGAPKTLEEVQKSYKNLVALLGKQGKVDANGNPVVAPATTTGTTTGSPTVTTLEIPKGDATAATGETKTAVSQLLDQYVDEFAKGNGKLSVESVAALTAKGVSPSDITDFLTLKVNQRAAAVNDVTSVVGGTENASKLLKFAASLPDADKGILDKLLKSGDPQLQKAALTSINQAWKKTYGTDVTFVASTGAANGTNLFSNLAEQSAAIADPRYATDRNYQRQVNARINPALRP